MPRKKASRPKVKPPADKGKDKGEPAQDIDHTEESQSKDKGKDKGEPAQTFYGRTSGSWAYKASANDSGKRKRNQGDGGGSSSKDSTQADVKSKTTYQHYVSDLVPESCDSRKSFIGTHGWGYTDADEGTPKKYGFSKHTPAHIAHMDIGTTLVGKDGFPFTHPVVHKARDSGDSKSMKSVFSSADMFRVSNAFLHEAIQDHYKADGISREKYDRAVKKERTIPMLVMPKYIDKWFSEYETVRIHIPKTEGEHSFRLPGMEHPERERTVDGDEFIDSSDDEDFEPDSDQEGHSDDQDYQTDEEYDTDDMDTEDEQVEEQDAPNDEDSQEEQDAEEEQDNGSKGCDDQDKGSDDEDNGSKGSDEDAPNLYSDDEDKGSDDEGEQ